MLDSQVMSRPACPAECPTISVDAEPDYDSQPPSYVSDPNVPFVFTCTIEVSRVVNVTCTATASSISFTPPQIDFGDQPAGKTSAPTTVTIANGGTQNLVITAAQIAGPFAQTGLTFPVTVAPGGTLAFSVTFSPTAAGAAQGSLTLASNDPTTREGLDNRVKVRLTADARLPDVTLTYVPTTDVMSFILQMTVEEAASAGVAGAFSVPPELAWASESTYQLLDFPLQVKQYVEGPIGQLLNVDVLVNHWDMTSCNGAIWYALHERNDMIGATSTTLHSKGDAPQLGPDRPVSVQLTFGDLACGGDLVLAWRDRTMLFNPLIQLKRHRVRARNPKKREVRDYLSSEADSAEDSLALLVLAYHESGFRQFFEDGDGDVPDYRAWLQEWGFDYSGEDIPGLPLVQPSGPRGRTFKGRFGIMQLDDPRWGPITREQIWDWRRNLERGVHLYELCKRRSLDDLSDLREAERERLHDPNVKLPFFRADQVRLEAWTKYRFGLDARYWGRWNTELLDWVPRGDLGDKAAYANGLDALAFVIESLQRCPGPETARALKRDFPRRAWLEPLDEWMRFDWCDPGSDCACRVPAKLTGVTVIANAVQEDVTGDKNWACVKKDTDAVMVEATTTPNTPGVWTRLQWTGGDAVPGHPNRRTVSRAASEKVHVEATLGSITDYVDIWILWAEKIENHLNDNETTPQGAVPFGDRYDGTESLGAQTFDGGNSAVGKVVPVAQLTPPGVHDVVKNGWMFRRERISHDWIDGKPDLRNFTTEWTPDTLPLDVKALHPNADDKIFDRDAPNITGDPKYYASHETYNNFREFVTWHDDMASDYALWYWQGRWLAAATPPVTLKEVGRGAIELPDGPYYALGFDLKEYD